MCEWQLCVVHIEKKGSMFSFKYGDMQCDSTVTGAHDTAANHVTAMTSIEEYWGVDTCRDKREQLLFSLFCISRSASWAGACTCWKRTEEERRRSSSEHSLHTSHNQNITGLVTTANTGTHDRRRFHYDQSHIWAISDQLVIDCNIF